jgi:hypothetical protein
VERLEARGEKIVGAQRLAPDSMVTRAVAYGVTRSLWSAVILHWLAVNIWLFVFGGRGKLHVNQTEILHESH